MATKDWRDNSLTDGDDITSIDVVEFLSLIEQFESGVIQDVDGDTKIQVEESSDEDKIRFDTGGTERAVLDSTGLDLASGLTYNIGGTAHNHDTSYISKPSGASANDLLAYIGSDWALVAKSWATGDMLYMSESGWERLAKGDNGQVLSLSSGIPSWQDIELPETVDYLHGVNYLPLADGKKTLFSQVNETTYTGTSTDQNITTLTLTETLNSKLTSGKSFCLAFRAEAKATASYVYYGLKNGTIGSAYYAPTNYASPYYYSPAITKVNEYNDTGYLTSLQYLPSQGTTFTITYAPPTYNTSINVYYKLTSTSNTLYLKNLYVYLMGYAFSTGTAYTLTDGVLDLYDDWKLTGFELYDSGDVMEINGITTTAYPFTRTINGGYSGTSQSGGTPSWNTYFEDMSEITSLKIVSGNPLLKFERV